MLRLSRSSETFPNEVEWIEVSVADTGTGIDDEELKKIFDPFFTTKEPGKGAGLGLAICQRIIDLLEVESKKGEGTTFSILLPASLKHDWFPC